MAAVTSVERVDIVLSGTTATAALTKGQDETKCVPFATRFRSDLGGTDDDSRINNVDVEIFDNAGTPTVRVTKGTSSGGMTLTVYVVEFGTDVNVQQGSVDQTGQSQDQAITAVDLSKTFALFYYTITGDLEESADDFDLGNVRTFLTTTTNLRFEREDAGGSFEGHWYVIEDTQSNFTVQSGTLNLSSVQTQNTATITSVDTAKAFTVASMEVNQTNDDLETGAVRFDLQDATTVRAIRGATGTETIDISWFVVEFDASSAFSVQRGLISFSTTSAQETAAINLVTDRAVAYSPIRHMLEASGAAGNINSNDVPDALVKVIIDGDMLGITADRTVTGNAAIEYAWEVIDFVQVVEFAFAFQADAEFDQNLVLSLSLAHTFQADAEFGQAASVNRAIAVSLQADANFQEALSLDLSLAHAFQADADFESALGRVRPFAFLSQTDADFLSFIRVTKGLAFLSQTDADFDMALSREAGMSANSQIDADFEATLFDLERRFKSSLVADADFAQLLGVDLPLASNMQVDADFLSLLEKDFNLNILLQVDADFVQLLSVDRFLAFLSQADADFLALLGKDFGIALALQADANFQQVFVRDVPLSLGMSSDGDFLQELTRTANQSTSLEADANFIQILIRDVSLLSDLGGDAEFLMEFETSRLAGSAPAFEIPNLTGEGEAFIVPNFVE